MIHILADSCSDLSPDLIETHAIEMISLSVFINDRTYLDLVELQTSRLFDLVAKTGSLPKTSAPTVAEFTRRFDRDGQTVFIGISGQLSATVNNARLAQHGLPERDVRVIDSLNLSAGIGLLVLKAAELRDQGLSIDQIEQQILASIPKVRTSFVIDTLEYLHKGGRCSALSMVVGSLLKIRPVIEIRPDGTLGVREKISGSRRKALNSLLVEFKRNLAVVDTHRVFITHTGCHQDAEYLAAEIRGLVPIDHLHITIAGATIASHCGPDTIGILYMTR